MDWLDRLLPGMDDEPLAWRLALLIVGGLGAALSTGWTEIGQVYQSLVLIMLADVGVAVIAACIAGTFRSSSMGKGALTKVAVLLALFALHQANKVTGLNVPAAQWMATIFVGRELMSIYETVARVYGLPTSLLAPIRNVLTQISEPRESESPSPRVP